MFMENGGPWAVLAVLILWRVEARGSQLFSAVLSAHKSGMDSLGARLDKHEGKLDNIAQTTRDIARSNGVPVKVETR